MDCSFYIVMLYCVFFCFFFFFNVTATTDIYTLSLHDALPIFFSIQNDRLPNVGIEGMARQGHAVLDAAKAAGVRHRSEEHTSELQSRGHLVCRLLLEKKK